MGRGHQEALGERTTLLRRRLLTHPLQKGWAGGAFSKDLKVWDDLEVGSV